MTVSIQKTIRVQQWVTITGFVLLLVKFLAYYLTHSVSILTDALESIVNVVAGAITLYSLYVAARPRDPDHPYGHGKAEYLSAGIEGTLIFIAGILIGVEAIRKLINPSPVSSLDSGIALVAICGAVNFVAGHLAIRTGKKNHSLAITATGKHLLSDAYSTVGLVIGLGILYFTQIWWIDSAIALIFGALIIFTGIKIIRSSVAGIMDEADTDILEKLVVLLNKQRNPTWIDLHNLRVIKYGNALHVDCHLTLPWYFNLEQAHQQIESLSNLIQEEFGRSLEFFIHTDPCRPFSCKICQVQNCPERKYPFEKAVVWTTENIFINQKHEIANA